jgi:signal transduction histidine kinase
MTSATAELRSPPLALGLLMRIGRGSTSTGRQVLVTAAATLFMLALGWGDVITGPRVHLGLLFVVPVLVAAWFGGRWPGYFVNVVSALVWLRTGFLLGHVDPRLTGSPVYDAVNLVIRCIFYASLIEVLVLIRNVGRQLEKSIQERTGELRQEITERLRAEESLRRLAAQLSAAEDVERRKLAYDIHDALSQMLGLVKMNLETVVAETATDSRQFERLSDVVKTVDDLIRQTREMTFDLHPSMLDHFGLIPTLQRFAQDFIRRTHAEVIVSESGERADLPAELASYLFRAIKELANNAIKHGNAREIIIAIHWEPGHLRMVVDDDGSGFDPVKAAEPQVRRGLGLAGIDERLTSFGGKMKTESQPGNGARIILEVPIPVQRAEFADAGIGRGLI